MRVGIDARCLNREHLRGMGKYVHHLVRLAPAADVRWRLYARRPQAPMHTPGGAAAAVSYFDCPGDRFHAWEQCALPRRAQKDGIDLLHCPASEAPWWQPVPTVVTVHDALPWMGQEPGWPRGWYVDRVLPRAFRKCAAVITDSESSRRDLIRIWPGLAPKTRVIALGVDDAYLEASPGALGPALQAAGVRLPYLLYLGGEIARKRLDWALTVFADLGDVDVRLVVCGMAGPARDRVREGLSPALRDRVCFVPFVSEADMPRLYQNAAAVLYPTLYEGFGLPTLEAAAVGTPALFSALGSLAELQAPGSVVLPPEDLTAWVQACRSLVRRRGADPRPDEPSRKWAANFSWGRCAARHLEVYREVVAGRGGPARGDTRTGRRGAYAGAGDERLTGRVAERGAAARLAASLREWTGR
jgi:glycosyltransferase involved in cell wall biosynthesis